MFLHLRHRTTFLYDGTARESFNEARLRPIDNRFQRCLSYALRTRPASDPHDFTDYYGNRAQRFSIAGSHSELVVEAESEVETVPDAERPPVPQTSAHGPEAQAEFEAQVEFLQSCRYVPLEGELEELARGVLMDRNSVWADAMNVSRYVRGALVYRPQATGVETNAVDALRLRAGVCQDFAHIAIGICRLAGIPARYVSGYFLNRSRRPDEFEASHAWAEVWVPGYGWAAFDPTHDRPVDERYVAIAVGRDYGDIRPVSGTYRGLRTRELRVEVEVRPVAATPSGGSGATP